MALEKLQGRLTEEHRRLYQDWLRLLVSLATVALTLLVALQSTYVPRNPRALWLLPACWSLLAISLLAGILALFGQAQTPLETVNRIRAAEDKTGRNPAFEKLLEMQPAVYSIPRPIFRWAAALQVAALGTGLAALVVFASLNLRG